MSAFCAHVLAASSSVCLVAVHFVQLNDILLRSVFVSFGMKKDGKDCKIEAQKDVDSLWAEFILVSHVTNTTLSEKVGTLWSKCVQE